MNYIFPIYWHIALPPTPNTFHAIAGDEPFNPDEIVPAFVIKLPLFRNNYPVERNFQGGTIMSLLQMIYEFYQAPVTSEELALITNQSSSFHNDRISRLIERQEAGEILKRIDVLGRASTCEEIRMNLLLVDV